jgi:uncharacterized membrane protein
MTMLERTYRQRLEADVARWQADGIITPAVGEAIRNALPPLGAGLNIPVVIAIAGGLLIAAAFLAFVASNWTEIPRVSRFAMLVTGIAVAHGAGAGFARSGRPILADLCVGVGAIIFGAAIALVGQMYHLGDDFAAGILLWAAGALTAAALTGSRGALAVALVAGSIWTCSRATEGADPHFQFVLFWLLSAGLPLAWDSRPAAHLVAISALFWWVVAAVAAPHGLRFIVADGIVADGAALLLGAGLLLVNSRSARLASFAAPLSIYGAFALAVVTALAAAASGEHSFINADPPAWAVGCGVAGAVLAFTATFSAAAANNSRAGTIFAGVAIVLVLVVVNGAPLTSGEHWLAFALELVAMLCLVVSGMLDGARPRMVAGWLGLAGVIAAITWAVKGSLLARSIFLAAAGAAAMATATLLGRLLPKENQP